MKYTNEVIINESIDKVIPLFDNTENMYEWMEGIKSHEFIEGEPGKVGSKMKMHFEMGKNKLDIVETILKIDLPKIFSASYNSSFSTNYVDISFEKVSPYETKYISHTVVKTHSFMMKILTFVSPGTFKKQSQKYLDSFKQFVENQK